MSDAIKSIEIVNGNGKEIEVSPIYNHLSIAKPQIKKAVKKDIVIPEEKKK